MQTLWNDRFTLPEYPRLTGTLYTDVAVVGGGIAGILTAYMLRERGVRVVLLEEDRLASGATAHTTAKISAQHGLFCTRLIENFGLHLARQYMRTNLHAVTQYRKLIEEKHIDCGFSTENSYLYRTHDTPSLAQELESARALGAPVKSVVVKDIPFSAEEALCFEEQAQFSPLPFLAALLPGLTVYEHSGVRSIRGHLLRCDGGSVHAEHIVVATHFPMLEPYGLYALRLHQQRSYILALENAPSFSGMWLDAGADGWSFRRSGKYLLMGGGGHRCGENLGDSYEKLRSEAHRLFPQAQEVYAWSTQDCVSLDGVPYIGSYSSVTPYLHVATGFGKWGMTGAMVAATLLSAQIVGSHYPYADIFSPMRFFPTASIETLMEGAGYAVRGISRRLSRRAETLTQHIAPGHGGIVRWQGKKYGVYRHTDGVLFAVDIRCPHLGCELQWNDDEKTWDCPCHGSRFGYDGHRLGNPARAALRPCKDFGRREI